jgi:hypothetical protein
MSNNKVSPDLFISNDLIVNPFNDKFVIINPIHIKSKNFWKSIINNLGGNWKNNKGGWVFPKYNLYKLKNSNTLSNHSSFSFDDQEDSSDQKDNEQKSSLNSKDNNKDDNKDDNKDNNKDDNKDEEDEDEEEDTSTDDELIQKVLARRFMSESTQDIIDNSLIEDSENEDVISLCRRLRHIYKELNNIKNQVKQ